MLNETFLQIFKILQINISFTFSINLNSKFKSSSLRSQCWMRLFCDFHTLYQHLDIYSYTLSKDHIFTLRRLRISAKSSTSSEGTRIDARRALALAAAAGICPGRYMTLWLRLAALRILCLSMAALTSENRRWANCSWVGGAKSSEFLGEDLGIGLLMTGGFTEGLRTLLERGDLFPNFQTLCQH